MRELAPLVSRRFWARALVAGLVLLGALLATPRARACGACATPELWELQDLGGELVLVTNFGLLAQHGDGWRVTCEEVFGGLLLAARGDSSEGWVSTDIGPFRRTGSTCQWSPGVLQHASWAWRFALARGESGGTTTRFALVIDSETQALHVERARGEENFRVVHSFESTSGFRELVAGGDPAAVFVAGFGAGADRLWQVAFSLDAGESWQTVVPELPLEMKWVLRFVDPGYPRAVFVESQALVDGTQGVWRFDATSGDMTELLSLPDGERFAGLTVLGDSVWIAGRAEAGGSLYRADREQLAFERVVQRAPPFACLAAHAGALYACVNDFTVTSDFLLGRSDDAGQSWQPLLKVEDLGRVDGCGSACDLTLEWLRDAFGASATGGAGGAPADGGAAGAPESRPEPAPAPSGCSCRFGGTTSSGAALLFGGVVLGALWRRRSRRAPSRLRVRLALVAVVAAPPACSEASPEGSTSTSSSAGGADCNGRGDDLASLRLTSGDLVLTLLEMQPEPPVVGDNEWLVFMSDASEAPVTGLEESLEVSAFMPEHGHGTPSAVGVQELDEGAYRLAPVNTFMPGLWRIRVAVERSDDPELFEFSVCVR